MHTRHTPSPGQSPIKKGGDGIWNDIVAHQSDNGVTSYDLTLHMAGILGSDEELATVSGWLDDFATNPASLKGLCAKIRTLKVPAGTLDPALDMIAQGLESTKKTVWTLRAYYDENLSQRRLEVKLGQPIPNEDEYEIVLAFLESPAGGPAIPAGNALLNTYPISKDPAARIILGLTP